MARKRVGRRRVVAGVVSIVVASLHLTMSLRSLLRNVQFSLDIRKQPGLDFDVFVNLQGDELHLTAAANFWVEWFPCTDEGVEADFFESVHGLLGGRLRIVEYYRRGKAFKAVLQRPINGGWESRKTWHSPRLPL